MEATLQDATTANDFIQNIEQQNHQTATLATSSNPQKNRSPSPSPISDITENIAGYISGKDSEGEYKGNSSAHQSEAASTYYSNDSFEAPDDGEGSMLVETNIPLQITQPLYPDHQSEHSNNTLLSSVTSQHHPLDLDSNDITLDRLIPPEHQLHIEDPNHPIGVTDSRLRTPQAPHPPDSGPENNPEL